MTPEEKPVFLMLETSTAACSAALSCDGRILARRYTEEPRSHARVTASFVSGMLEETGLRPQRLAAVSVSKGPGSYTGLRVGVSTAKGICFGAGIPLIGIGTLEILAEAALPHAEKDSLIVPMVDARRMEVYTARFAGDGTRLSETEAVVLDANSFREEFSRYGRLIFVGDGAAKFRDVLDPALAGRSLFLEAFPKADDMARLTAGAYAAEKFEDVAYFEPFYLKEFVAGVSRKSVLGR